MPRTVVIHDPRTRKKPEVLQHTYVPHPVTGKVYIVLNTVLGVPGAHVVGVFSKRATAIKVVQALSGDRNYSPGTPAQLDVELWDVVESEVVEGGG